MKQDIGEKRDLVLNPGEFAFLQDLTRGQIKSHVGPLVVNQTGQESPVIFNARKNGTGSFERCHNLESAVCEAPVASEGDYLVLYNPAEGGKHPNPGSVENCPELLHGRRENLPGPVTFALWPGQCANVIKGHTLRSNQFLVVRVYNEEQALANWNSAVVKKIADGNNGSEDNNNKNTGEDNNESSGIIDSNSKDVNLAIGQRYIIKGTEVSFYIPPTGIEVVPAEKGNYVRNAITLERLEYAILIDEDGNKRYEKGPQVVVPEPTEEFYSDGKNTKFKAIELNHIQGIQVKVIAPYEENGKQYEEGQELFITGKECAIYYPRPEHSIIRYGDNEKYYAVAVPVGEGRYVMNRQTGEIRTVTGPQLLLPNPVNEVIVRRVLSDKEVDLWYPGNTDAVKYNRDLRSLTDATADTGYSDAVAAATASLGDYETKIPGGFKRGTTFSKPRELTLNTKYDGVPGICPWTGYAVMVVSKKGKRRVVQGPDMVLLNYDESLEVMSLSTGKPKTTDRLMSTVYLRVKNNKVSDKVTVITSDHVKVELKLAFRVNFVGENKEKWFEVENYVKLLCDHVRSILAGAIRKINIETFYSNGVDIVRNLVLGESKEGKREGMMFTENAMKVDDVEVLNIEIVDGNIKNLLENAQYQVVASNIQLEQAEQKLKDDKRREKIVQERLTAEEVTNKLRNKIEAEKIVSQQELNAASAAGELAEENHRKEMVDLQQVILDAESEAKLVRTKADKEVEIDHKAKILELKKADLEAETKAIVDKFAAGEGTFAEALVALQNKDTIQKIAEATNVQRIIGGDSIMDAVSKMLDGTGFADVAKNVISNKKQ
jgi:major vault protein